MAEFGWTVPCLVGDGGELIAGRGRVLAAAQLGLRPRFRHRPLQAGTQPLKSTPLQGHVGQPGAGLADHHGRMIQSYDPPGGDDPRATCKRQPRSAADFQNAAVGRELQQFDRARVSKPVGGPAGHYPARQAAQKAGGFAELRDDD